MPTRRWAEVANALAAAAAEIAAGHASLARIGIVADEPPVLAVFRPRRDVVAAQVRDTLTAGASHRRPQVWLTLQAGVYLANVIDPDAPFAATPASLAGIVATGKVRHAVAIAAAAAISGVALRVTVYSTPGGVRSSLVVARRALATLPGWVVARTKALAAPSTALNSKLHR